MSAEFSSLLAAYLIDNVIFTGGLEGLKSCFNRYGEWLFAVHIFFGFSGHDRRNGMPMVGGADEDGIHAFVRKCFTEIDMGFAVVIGPVFFTYPAHGVVEAYLSYFCHTHDTAIFLPQKKVQMTSALFAYPDKANVDGLTWLIGPSLAGDNIGCNHGSRCCGLDELST